LNFSSFSALKGEKYKKVGGEDGGEESDAPKERKKRKRVTKTDNFEP